MYAKVCLKMLFFWKKSAKIVSASGAPPPNTRWLPAAGGSAPNSPRCYSRLLLQLCRDRFYC